MCATVTEACATDNKYCPQSSTWWIDYFFAAFKLTKPEHVRSLFCIISFWRPCRFACAICSCFRYKTTEFSPKYSNLGRWGEGGLCAALTLVIALFCFSVSSYFHYSDVSLQPSAFSRSLRINVLISFVVGHSMPIHQTQECDVSRKVEKNKCWRFFSVAIRLLHKLFCVCFCPKHFS